MSLLRSITFKEWAASDYGSKQIWNSYWQAIYEEDPTLKDAVVTIELVFGSAESVLISTRPITTISKTSGIKYNYLPLLESSPQLSSEYSIGSGSASQRSFSLTVAGRVLKDPFLLLEYNFALAGFAEISVQIDGKDYDQRIVIMKGEMDSLNFGNKDEYLEFSVTDISQVFSEIVPKFYITKENFEFAPDDSIGLRYPLVFDRHFAVPCIRLDKEIYGPMFMVCSGHDFDVVTVYVDGLAYAAQGSTYQHSIKYEYDADSNPFTGIDFDYAPQSGILEIPSGASVYAEVVQKAGRYRNAIALAEAILAEYSLFGIAALDKTLFGKSKAKIGQIELQILINGSDTNNAARALRFVEETICSQLPMVSMVYSRRGYGAVVTNRNAENIGHFNAHQFPFIDRASGVQESSKSELFNSFIIRYHYNPLTDNYERVIKVNSSNNAQCRKSESQIGRREHEILESIYVYDDESANIIVSWMADHLTMPCYYIEYEAYPILFFKLDLGDNILFTDDKLGFSNYTATVVKKSYENSTCIIGIKLWV